MWSFLEFLECDMVCLGNNILNTFWTSQIWPPFQCIIVTNRLKELGITLVCTPSYYNQMCCVSHIIMDIKLVVICETEGGDGEGSNKNDPRLSSLVSALMSRTKVPRETSAAAMERAYRDGRREAQQVRTLYSCVQREGLSWLTQIARVQG